MGYCQDIFVLQTEHFPFKKTKLITGKSSYHLNFLAQPKHFDWPEIIDCPVFKRSIMTLRKLPITAPKMKMKMLVIMPSIITQKNPDGHRDFLRNFLAILRSYIISRVSSDDISAGRASLNSRISVASQRAGGVVFFKNGA